MIFKNGPYFMGTQGLYLNRWTLSFDPASEVPKDVPVWVRLPNLPIHCWNPTSLQAIGNGLGRYIDRVEPRDQYSCVWIYVEVDLEVGLPEAIKLKVSDWHHFQNLDYEQLLFKCRGCHEYGHFQSNCPKNSPTEKAREEGWQQARKGKSKPKGQRNEQTVPQNTKSSGTKDTENSFNILAKEVDEGELVPSKEVQEGEKGDQNFEDKGNQPIEEEGVQNNSPHRLEFIQNIEDGEISIGSDSDEANEVWVTPKKTGRGRKTKKTERDQETYKDVLNGSQPTIKQLISIRHTRKQAKASQGGHPSPQGL